MSREEIVESMVHLAPYVGVPKALAGLRAVGTAFAALDAAADSAVDG